jgi:hypothetical protein
MGSKLDYTQPIITGIEAVGSVKVTYRYLSTTGSLPLPSGWKLGTHTHIQTGTQGVAVAGFRLDSEFLRAAQQISSSMMIPILGGGAVAITNNNRSGTLTINSTRVSAPKWDATVDHPGAMLDQTGEVYDIVLLAQCQQGCEGGDSTGADITVSFNFNNANTSITFQSCTVANVAPLALAGNDAPNYTVEFNYLNWVADL